MHNFLKIHAHLGVRLPRKAYFFVEFTCCFFFFFHAQVSISNSDCPCNQRTAGRTCLRVKVVAAVVFGYITMVGLKAKSKFQFEYMKN